MRTCLLLFSLLLSLAAPAARADASTAWAATFPAESLATWLDAPSARYLLVPAGTAAPELTQAEQALATALRGGGKASLVMSAQALGPVAQLDDAAIVQRGAGFPVDRILVLRLFPDASGALTQAVVTSYDTTGASRGAFSATRGTALAPRPPASSTADAEAPVPTPSAPATPAPPRTPGQDPVQEYEQRYIGFDELIAVRTATGTVVSRNALPYEGKFKRPLEGNAFYKKLGREDLVKAYDDKMNFKIGLGVAGGLVGLGGLIYGINAPNIVREESCSGTGDYASSKACFDRNWERSSQKQRIFATGLGISAAGLGLFAVGMLINPQPIAASEARELADGYNQKLKSELGLSEDGKPVAPPARPSSIQAQLLPVLDAEGGGLVLRGIF